jgi:type IV secretory pathway TraG/TraD family ATPase VirD4
LLEMFFGLAAIEMQSSTSKNATPVLMALDEAGNIPPPKLQDRLKIGRFRNTPYLLGFQDVNQIKNKFQENGGKAVLAGMKNQVFLPGIDPDTGAYASSLLGPTTVLSRTEVDASGTQNDAERVSESRRDLRQAPELRRMVKYRQGIAIIDTADPILFRFPQRADNGDVAAASRRSLSPAPSLADAVTRMNELMDEERQSEKDQAVVESTLTPPLEADAVNTHETESSSNPAAESKTPTVSDDRVRMRDIEEKRDQNVLPFESQSDEEGEESCAA